MSREAQARSCRKKLRFERHLDCREAIENRYRDPETPGLGVYYCPVCHGFHMTSKVSEEVPAVVQLDRSLTHAQLRAKIDKLTAKNAGLVKGLQRGKAKREEQAKQLQRMTEGLADARGRLKVANQELNTLRSERAALCNELEMSKEHLPQLTRLRAFVDLVRSNVPPEIYQQLWDEVDRSTGKRL